MFSVSCFDDCHISVMVVVVAVVSKNYLLNDHTRTNIFNIHNNHYIIVQGHRGDQGGWDLILQIVYLSRRLRSRAVEYFSHIEHLMRIHAGNCGHTFSYLARRFTLYI